MANASYSATIKVDPSPQIVFDRICDVPKWWSGDFEGESSRLGDEFVIHHPGRHYSRQRLIEVVPGKRIVWLVTDCRLNWLERDKHEWTHTRMVFDIIAEKDGTTLRFTHEGLVPEKECYARCAQGWDVVIKDWLCNFIRDDRYRNPVARSAFVHVAYIRTTPEKLWSALTEAESMRRYWFGVHCESEWTAGASWKLIYPDGRITDAGEIVEAERPRRLVMRWRHQAKPEFEAEGESYCMLELDPDGPAVRLALTHIIQRDSSKFIAAISAAWPMVISNLKSWMENGTIVLQHPFSGSTPNPQGNDHETVEG